MQVQPSVASHSDNASSSLVIVLKVRTSRLIVPSTVCRTQATTVSPAFARAGSYARRGRRNADTELPSLPSCRSAPPGVGRRQKNSRNRAPEPLPAHGALRGAPAFRVEQREGLSRTKQNPTFVPERWANATIDFAPFHRSAGRR